MKKILFIMTSMGVGGTVKSLVELLKVLPLDVYEVHLGLFIVKGDFLDKLPQGIHIHEIPKSHNSKEMFLTLMKTFHWIDAITFIFRWIYSRLFRDYYQIYRYTYRNVPYSAFNYDLAVAYKGMSSECVYYLCEKVHAKSKCLWVHEDVTIPWNRNHYKMVERLYKCLDKIFIVSEEGKEHFDLVYPQMKNKTDVFHNIIPIDNVMIMAEEGHSFDDNFMGKRILTVGRIHHSKGILIAIKTLKLLMERKLKVKWYFIGGNIGNSYYEQCRVLSIKEGVADYFVFLDVQMNPYKYMRDCDVYVQPSLFETYCTTVMEALCFGNPIVTTCFCGAHEQLRDRANGYITELSPESLAEGIEKALNDKKISVQPVQRTTDLEKLYRLIS
jgi:glycosyltransferase involved in cell wall biosynthesis